jgi:acyl-CoA synthetase (NDP forming)
MLPEHPPESLSAVASAVFSTAAAEGREALLEHEVYALLDAVGLPVPRHLFVPAGGVVDADALRAFVAGAPGLVVKVVSPQVLHKSDVGGVAFCAAEPEAALAACAGVLSEVAARAPGAAGTLRGCLLVERVAYASIGFGAELLVGLRRTRELGAVLTVGAGGLDVEHLAARLPPDAAAATVAAELFEPAVFASQLAQLAVYGKMAAPFRGRPALIAPDVLVETAQRLAWLGALRGPYVVEELEVNPFVVRAGALVPLDGLCRFSVRPEAALRAGPDGAARTVAPKDLGPLLRPATIGLIGVSEKMNLGRVILRNVLAAGFSPAAVTIVKPGLDQMDGCLCVPSIEALPAPVDLFVLTLAAEQCPDVIAALTAQQKARAVILIAGGMGETENGAAIEAAMRATLAQARAAGLPAPVVNGGNCLGIVSRPGAYDTTFIPAHKHPPAAPAAHDAPGSGLSLVSQSGAFLLSRTSKLPHLAPRYQVSLGNQLDVTVSDHLAALVDDPGVRQVAVYLEGLQPGDGLPLARAVRALTRSGRDVLIYKAGRSPEGRAATSSHTASVAGDYGVFRAVMRQAGAVVVESLRAFEAHLTLLTALSGRPVHGRRVGLMSNAGFECVVLADQLAGGLTLAAFTDETRARIARALHRQGIDRLQDVHNPLDVTPVADDLTYGDCAAALLADPGVDAAVFANVPMTGALNTLPASPELEHGEDLTRPGGWADHMRRVFASSDKPMVFCIDAGERYTPLATYLAAAGLPVFRHADEAASALTAFIDARLR